MNNPKISVCIPVYNGADYIRDAINSVLSQDFSDFELLIIDNHSTDNTINVVKEFNDTRIKLIINESNIGLIPNWNKAIEMATGLYIKILPADDFIYPGCLKKQCSILDADLEEKISMVCARRNIVDTSGKILFNRGVSKKNCLISGIKAINKNTRSGGNIIGEAGAVMFRKRIIEKTGLFNSDIFYVLDLDLWYKILLFGNLYVFSDILSAFRVSGSSASVKIINNQHRDNVKFIKKIYTDRSYKLSLYSYYVGILKSFFLTLAKKILYKYILK